MESKKYINQRLKKTGTWFEAKKEEKEGERIKSSVLNKGRACWDERKESENESKHLHSQFVPRACYRNRSNFARFSTRTSERGDHERRGWTKETNWKETLLISSFEFCGQERIDAKDLSDKHPNLLGWDVQWTCRLKGLKSIRHADWMYVSLRQENSHWRQRKETPRLRGLREKRGT